MPKIKSDRSGGHEPLSEPSRKRGNRGGGRQSRIIGFFSCKGGVGKTTTVINAAIGLSPMLGGKALTVDANLSAPNIGLYLGLLDPEATIHDAITGKIPIGKAITKCRGLDILLGSISNDEEVRIVNLRSFLEPLQPSYRLILVDSSPGIGAEVISAMKSCDEIIVVTNPEIPTVAATLKTFLLAEKHKVQVSGVVVNMVRGESSELPIRDLRKALGWPIIAVVPEDKKVREGASTGVPVAVSDPKSPAALEFKKLSEFIAKR